MLILNGTTIKPTIFEDEKELFYLTQLRCLLLMEGTLKPVYLYIDYLPYARQDKLVSNNTTFSLWPMIQIINIYGYEKVTILDPHSLMFIETVKNSTAIYPRDQVYNAVKETQADFICYPDKGAKNKYSSIYKDISFVYAEKTRNQLIGEITGLKLFGNVENKNILIVDDICDGGKTFIELTKILYENKAKYVSLFVTHGLFSKGLAPLKEVDIKRFFTKKGEIL